MPSSPAPRRAAAGALLAAQLLWMAPAAAAPTGTVVMRDGRRFEDVEYEVRGKSVWVKRELGEVTYPLSLIKELIPSAGDAAPELDEGVGPSAGDWETRFLLEPPEGWEVGQAKGPMVRGVLRHKERDAALVVSVRPAEGEWSGLDDPRGRIPREIADAVTRSVEAFYAKVGRAEVRGGRYQGAQVLWVDEAEVTPYGSKRLRVITEVRFRSDGFEYAVTYSVAKEDRGALAHTVQDVLGCFSFLPALNVGKSSYSDFVRGFALRMPEEDWEMEPQPFDASQPLRLSTAKGRGEVLVLLKDQTNADEVVRGMIAERKKRSRFLANDKVGAGQRDGSPVVEFSFEDFREGGKKKLSYKGFGALIRGKVLLFVGLAPLSDEDATKIQGEVDAILASVTLHDLDRIRNRMAKERDALHFLSQGFDAFSRRRYSEAIQRFDDAIAANDQYAQAYHLRGLAKKEGGDFAGYEADLQKADELDPGAGYAEDLAGLDREKAEAAMSNKDWATALDLWAKTVRRVRGEDRKKVAEQLVKAAEGVWGEHKKQKNWYRGGKELEGRLRPVSSVPEVEKFLVDMYKDAGSSLAKEGEFSHAKYMARKMRGLARGMKDDKLVQAADKLFDDIAKKQEDARKR